jgi:hypothetical protein
MPGQLQLGGIVRDYLPLRMMASLFLSQYVEERSLRRFLSIISSTHLFARTSLRRRHVHTFPCGRCLSVIDLYVMSLLLGKEVHMDAPISIGKVLSIGVSM